MRHPAVAPKELKAMAIPLAIFARWDYSPRVPTVGERPGEKGREGVHRAKNWLERSTRFEFSYTAYDNIPSVDLLTFNCPGGGSASFDIGGTFRGEELSKKSFLAEVKNYGPKSDQYPEFKKFLALCYIAYKAKPHYCERLIWISWRPFKSEKWDELTSINEVAEAVVGERQRVFGPEVTPEEARGSIDMVAAAAVAERLWLIVLSEGNETLVITHDHYSEIVKIIAREARP
jgi:hypothetical protein